MNTHRQLSKLCIIAALMLAAVVPAQAVRPYNPKTRSAPYVRTTRTSIINYLMPVRKSWVEQRPHQVQLVEKNLTGLKSWTGLGATDRRINGDTSPYGANRIPSQTDKRDTEGRRQVQNTRLRLSSAPYGIR